MSLALYMDENVEGAITEGLRGRRVDVLIVVEDGRMGFPDPAVLDRAGELGRLLFTHDDDLLREAKRRQENSEPFAGVVYGHHLRVTFGQAIDDLAVIAEVCNFAEFSGHVEYLPL